MSDHTPAPWTFDLDWHLIMGPNGEEIAAVHSAQVGDTARRVDHITVHANAKAMTAAPELIEALRLTMRELDDMCSTLSNLGGEIGTDAHEAIEIARAALAKAEAK